MRNAFFLVLAAAALSLGTVACKKEATPEENQAAKEAALRDAAKAEAAKRYNELITKYPDSKFAAQARQRLDAIGPVATPAPKH